MIHNLNLPISHGIVASDNVLSRPAHPQGMVMLVHGGGWFFTGKLFLETGYAQWFNRHGYATYDVDYRAGVDSIGDVVADYDYLRHITNLPICVQGGSAGGSLALQLAALRPGIRCIITEGAVVNITTMPANFQSFVYTNCLGNRLWQFSPARVARYIRQPVLMGGSSTDPVVPERSQLAAIPQAHTLLLKGVKSTGAWYTQNFTHASVTTQALSSWHRAELQLLSSTLTKEKTWQPRWTGRL